MKTNYMNLAITLTFFFLPHVGGLIKPPKLLFFQISNFLFLFLFLFGEFCAGKKKKAGSESVMHIML